MATASKLHVVDFSDTYTRLTTVLVLLWGVFDTVTTYIAVYVYGSITYEANPFVRYLLSAELVLFIVVKFVSVLLIVVIAVKGEKYITTVPYWKAYFSMLCVATGCVIVNNVIVILHGLR